ncbi:MAG TPA: transcription-repair coupling factor, partial [Actinomycetota bacterium]|nr:transcription-repair coupling factor [Actinomycetota bacterium]
MRLEPLLDRLPADPAFQQLRAALEGADAQRVEAVVPDVARAFLLAGLAAASGRLLVVVTATTADAEAIATDVAAFLGPDRAAWFPAWETLPHERLSPRSETVARRLALIRRLSPEGSGEPQGGAPVGSEGSGDGLAVLTVPARAMMQPLAPGLDAVEPVRVARGDRVELEDLLERLVASGYQRTDMVERRGEVAVRGGLVDFFPPGEDHPVRVELWGDEVESIRAF